MGKILNFLKKHSFGKYTTGLYSDGVSSFGSVVSVVFSGLFILGISVGVGMYFYEIFI